MKVLNTAADTVARTADAAVAGAGGLGGAVVNGVVGGVQGTTSGVVEGLGKGRRSLPAAALTSAGIGAAGLVEWPVVPLLGDTAVAIHQINERRHRADTTRKAQVPNGN